MQENTQSQSDNMAQPPNEFWHESQIKDLILFAQAVREENDEMKARIMAMDAMMKNKDAVLKKANLYIRQLEMIVAQNNETNWN